MNPGKSKNFLISIIFILIFVHIYMKIYLQYLQKWPFPYSGTMNTLSLFSLKHFGALVFNIFFGMIFGVEHLLKNMKCSGKWYIDIKRLIIIGLPSLLFSIEAIHFFFIENILKGIGLSTFHLTAPAREPFFGFLIGYTILTSFYKK